MPQKALKTVFFLIVLHLAAGCAPSHYSMRNLTALMGSIKTVGIVQPDIKVFELSEDGVAVMNEVSEAAMKSSAEELAAFFKGANLKTVIVEPDLRTRKEIQEVRALSKAVHRHLQEFWNPVDNAPLPSLGSMEALAGRYNVDAFIFMDGLEVHKVEKKGLSKTLATYAVGTLYGPSALPRKNRTRASVSIADHGGRILWASFMDSPVSVRENFMGLENTRRLVRRLLSNFPR